MPLGAAISMPLCGLRDWPLNIRLEPNELLRTPGTGWVKVNSSGSRSLQRLSAASMPILSLLDARRILGRQVHLRGATVSAWVT